MIGPKSKKDWANHMSYRSVPVSPQVLRVCVCTCTGGNDYLLCVVHDDDDDEDVTRFKTMRGPWSRAVCQRGHSAAGITQRLSPVGPSRLLQSPHLDLQTSRLRRASQVRNYRDRL